MKSLYEQMGGMYREFGDYVLPNLILPEKDNRTIGVWGQRRIRYLKEHHKVLYYNLLTSCKLRPHLADIEEEAQELFLRIVKELAEEEKVTDKLKGENQMEWVRKMNNIRNRATEIVNAEVLFI